MIKQPILNTNFKPAEMEKYLPYLDGTDMTDEQKKQCVRALYSIMDHFVYEAWEDG